LRDRCAASAGKRTSNEDGIRESRQYSHHDPGNSGNGRCGVCLRRGGYKQRVTTFGIDISDRSSEAGDQRFRGKCCGLWRRRISARVRRGGPDRD
jgi:hypothetical protein